MNWPCPFSIVNGVAEGEVLSDPDVQKAALQVISNCVCGPSTRVSWLCITFIINGAENLAVACHSKYQLCPCMQALLKVISYTPFSRSYLHFPGFDIMRDKDINLKKAFICHCHLYLQHLMYNLHLLWHESVLPYLLYCVPYCVVGKLTDWK